jgi:hypothetical protein
MSYLYEACDQISDFCQSIVAEKNETKNIRDRRMDRGKTVYPPPVERGYNNVFTVK